MPAKNPTVSVIMPVYNGADYLNDSISSVLNQTYTDFELIILDDNSSDSSLDIINSFAKKDDRIVVVKNNPNLGQSPSANKGYRLSKGTYVARMDQDDIMLPNRLADQVSFLDTHPDHFLVGGQVEIINQDGQVQGPKTFPTTHDEMLQAFGKYLPLCHPAIIVRKSKVHTPDRLWFEEGDPIPDTYTFLYYITREKFANVPTTVLQYRVHSENGSYQNIRAIFLQTIRYRIKAIREWGYPFRWQLPFIWLAQAIPVLLLPNKLVLTLFMMYRGTYNWKSFFMKRGSKSSNA